MQILWAQAHLIEAHKKMNTTQTSPNGGGWEWGLKNSTQTKDTLLKLYNLPLGI